LVYLIYCFVNELFNTYFNQTRSIQEFLLWNIFDIVEYSLLTFYIRRLIRNKSIKQGITVISAGFLLIAFIFTIRTWSSNVYNSFVGGLGSILLIFYSIIYLFEQIRKPDHLFFYAIPEFWIIVAILLYFSGTFFFFSLSEDNSFTLQYALINSSFYILKNLLLAVAMCVKGDDQSYNISKKTIASLGETPKP
jgi:hypothetical protein